MPETPIAPAEPNMSKPTLKDREGSSRVKKVPQFLRNFSKREENQDVRNEAARQIRAKRKEYFDGKRDKKFTIDTVRQKSEEVKLTEAESLAELSDLETTISELSDGWALRTLNTFKIRNLVRQKEDKTIDHNRYLKELTELKKEEDELTRSLENKGVNAELGEARTMLRDFYEQQKQEWASTSPDIQEMKQLFDPQHLASLSLDEYVTLLKRFPSHMVTHVTRQGVRDHFGHGMHSKGLWEHANGFKDILKDGKLRSVYGNAFKDGMSQEAVAKHFGFDRFKTKEEAVRWANGYLKDAEGSGGLFDTSSVHVAAEEVADFYYGSEGGNEVFFAFPSAVIATNHYSKGTLFNSVSDSGWNDTWLYDEDNTGIPVKSAITFLPGTARVDPRNGSQYELDDQNVPVPNQERNNILKTLIREDKFVTYLEKISDIESKPYEQKPYLKDAIKNEIKAAFQIEDEGLLDALVYFQTPHANIGQLLFAVQSENGDTSLDPQYLDAFKKRGGIDTVVEAYLKGTRTFYLHARNTVSSKEYWESYFKENPDIVPNKIVYYSGSPSDALRMWRNHVGLTNLQPVDHELYSKGYPQMDDKMSMVRQAAYDAIDVYFPQAS